LEIAQQIAALEKELAAILGNKSVAAVSAAKPAVAAPAKRKRRKLSPEAIARIVAAQKKRWAKVKAGAPKAATAKAPEKKKRKVSPEVRAKLAAAMKARWDKAKAGKAPAPTAKK
jgi:hypothetical protein